MSLCGRGVESDKVFGYVWAFQVHDLHTRPKKTANARAGGSVATGRGGLFSLNNERALITTPGHLNYKYALNALLLYCFALLRVRTTSTRRAPSENFPACSLIYEYYIRITCNKSERCKRLLTERILVLLQVL